MKSIAFHLINSPPHTNYLQSLTLHCNIACLAIFYCNFHASYTSELANCMPPFLLIVSTSLMPELISVFIVFLYIITCSVILSSILITSPIEMKGLAFQVSNSFFFTACQRAPGKCLFWFVTYDIFFSTCTSLTFSNFYSSIGM